MLAHFLPTEDRQALKAQAALDLAADLEANRLEVALLPAPQERHQGHHVRQVVAHNPDWYRDLCAPRAHPRRARHDTAIAAALSEVLP